MKQAGGKVVALNFTQTEKVLDSDYDIKNGNNPYYQWGRKDPMLPGNGIGDADKTCYTTDDHYQFAYQGHGVPLNTTDIKEYIKNPHKFNINVKMDGQYYNLWSTDNDRTDNNDEVVIKSVYDPSPVGYSLPASNAFTGFTTTGGNVDNRPNPLTPDKINAKLPFDKGYYFYTKKNKQGIPFFFPASGFRHDRYGFLLGVNTSGYCWMASLVDMSNSYSLVFSSSAVYPLHHDSRSCGLPVRSAEEKEWTCVL